MTNEPRTYNRLTIIEEAPRLSYRPGKRYLCRCKCGRTTIAYLHDLKNGHAKSCGCLQKEARAKQSRLYSKYFKTLAVEPIA